MNPLYDLLSRGLPSPPGGGGGGQVVTVVYINRETNSYVPVILGLSPLSPPPNLPKRVLPCLDSQMPPQAKLPSQRDTPHPTPNSKMHHQQHYNGIVWSPMGQGRQGVIQEDLETVWGSPELFRPLESSRRSLPQ